MRQYTTAEVLRMMEEWYEQHKEEEGFDAGMPFKGFDCLLGAHLNGVDLSRDTIEQKAEEYRRDGREKGEPPWRRSVGGAVGVDLCGAVLSTHESPVDFGDAKLQGAHFGTLTGVSFYGAQLQGALFNEAELQGARFEGAQLQKALFNEAELQGARFEGAQLQKAFFDGAQLQEADFHGAQLQEADFRGAQLQKADFTVAQLQKAFFEGAQLRGARFEGAQLQKAFFGGAQLQGACFEGARLQGAYLATELAEALLEDVSWDNDYVLGHELDRKIKLAESGYRHLKQYYNGAGKYDLAGDFHRRELLMKRKQLWKKGPGAWREAAVLLASAMLMGHGERPSWVVGWVFACFAAFTAAYWLLNALPDGSLVESIRHSAQTVVPFGRREDAAMWAQDAGLAQSFISYVLLALFLVTFVRKVSPR